jgi:hypothetical protein
MDDATSTVLSRELAENRQLKQQAQLWQGVAALLQECGQRTGADWPLSPALSPAPEPGALMTYGAALEAYLLPLRAPAPIPSPPALLGDADDRSEPAAPP